MQRTCNNQVSKFLTYLSNMYLKVRNKLYALERELLHPLDSRLDKPQRCSRCDDEKECEVLLLVFHCSCKKWRDSYAVEISVPWSCRWRQNSCGSKRHDKMLSLHLSRRGFRYIVTARTLHVQCYLYFVTLR